MQAYGSYILGKCPCGPKSQVILKRPWALTWDTTVLAYSYTTVHCILSVASDSMEYGVSGKDTECSMSIHHVLTTV